MEIDRDFRMLIDGQLVDTVEQLAVENPATGQAFANCPRAGRDDLERAVQAAKTAFKSWKKVPLAERRQMLILVAGVIAKNADALASLFTKEQGRPTHLAKEEILGASYWMQSTAGLELPVEVTEETDTRRIEVQHHPLGVVCGIVPWNFPILLASWKIGPALLTGNTIVLKPSPFTPLTTLKIAELLQDAFPPGVFNVISGGDELGPWMTSHPDFAKISFTGSTATGKRVMESASKDLKRITLELGGNDAAIVLPDVNVDKIAERIFAGAFSNTAQICVATKRLYIHSDIYDQLRDKLHEIAKSAVVGNGSNQGVQYGPVQNRVQYERVMNLMESAKEDGLTLLQGKDVPENGYFIPLTLVDNPPESARVVQEEAFGPILPLLKFETVEDVIERANNTDYGLAGAVWSSDLEKAQQVASELDTGTVWINQNLESTPFTPLAGAKQSGFGVENGVYGLKEFTQPKSVFIPKSNEAVSA